jgi:hypothetical protein
VTALDTDAADAMAFMVSGGVARTDPDGILPDPKT